MKTKVSALFIGSCLLVSSMSAMGADMMVRMRAISVMPVETGTVAGGDVTISNAAVPVFSTKILLQNLFWRLPLIKLAFTI